MKKQLRQLLEERSTGQIVDLAARRRRTLNLLISLTFDRDPLIQWRAVEAMGAAAAHIAEEDPACVRDHLRRLYWLLSEESGGICWRAPEAIGEIVRRSPEAFSDYASIVVSLLDEMADEDLDHFRSGILWAIGRLGPIANERIEGVLSKIEACLDHADPQVRGMAVWCWARWARPSFSAAAPSCSPTRGPSCSTKTGCSTRPLSVAWSGGHSASQSNGLSRESPWHSAPHSIRLCLVPPCEQVGDPVARLPRPRRVAAVGEDGDG